MSEKNIMGVNLNIDQEYIKQSVEEIVKAGIVGALGDPSIIVRKAVDKFISKKVDDRGRETDSYYGQPYLNWLAEKTVENTVRDAMNEYVQAHTSELKEEIIRVLNTKKFKQNTAEAFLKTLVESGANRYKMPISISFEEPNND